MWDGNGTDQQTVHGFQLFWRQRCEDVVQSLVHVNASADPEAQTVTDGVLGKQDGALSVAFHIIHDPAKADPAGIHSVQYVGRCDVSVRDPDSDCTEGDLIGRQAVQRTKWLWLWLCQHQVAEVAQHCQISKNPVVFGPVFLIFTT